MKSRFVIAALHSGAGKTTITLGIMAALRARGLVVQSFKVGPDFIDPMHHETMTGRTSHNLDTWMIPEMSNREIYANHAADADVTIVEGVMGLFDGIDGKRPDGSTEHLARLLSLPVVLVVDARSMARSAAAIVNGAVSFVPELTIAGIIWNRVGSAAHRRILDEAVATAGLPPVLGAFGRHEGISLGERHLGLVTPDDSSLPADWTGKLSELTRNSVDLDALLAITTGAPPAKPLPRKPAARKRVVAVALDRAFCFYYEENLRILEELGCRLVYFRPAEGDGVPQDAQAVYLGGGYPELHAAKISSNEAFIGGLRSSHKRGLPIYAECGGFMALCDSLDTGDGIRVPMAGIFPAQAVMGRRLHRLGYRELTGKVGSPVEGLTARGHEFHYSSVGEMPTEIERIYRVSTARGEPLPDEGYRIGSTTGGYMHLHFASNTDFIARLFNLK